MEYREDKFTSQKGDFKIEEKEPADGQLQGDIPPAPDA